MLFTLAVLCGFCAMLLCIPMMFRESKRRHILALRRMHTRFVPINCKVTPVDLYCTNMKIGRQRSKCDISLHELAPPSEEKRGARKQPQTPEAKSQISRVHAILWWDGFGFRIAPANTLLRKPKVWVGEKLAPPRVGLPVTHESVITISEGGYQFMLVNTSPNGEPIDLHPKRSKKTRHKGLTAIAAIMVVFALAAGILLSFFTMPQSEFSLGPRKEDTATFLICGIDASGNLTDTMMLVYVSGSEKRIGLLSLPRDTISVNKNGKTCKLNAIYGGNKEEGMEELLDVVQKYIGYRPDGYVCFDWDLVVKITDLMGGVDLTLDHYIRVHKETGEEIYVPEGKQHLDGEQTLAALRYRAGYYNADLGRINVQRQVITACAKQWITPSKLDLVDDALELLQAESMTDLTTNELLWIAKTVFMSMDTIDSETLKGYDEYRNKVSYYILSPEKIMDQINESFNPYTVNITREMLDTVK